MHRIWLTLATLLCAAAPAYAAEDCSLNQYASLPIVTLPGGPMVVAVTAGGKSWNFEIAFGHAYTEVTAAMANELGLQRVPMPHGVALVSSQGSIAEQAKIPELDLGPVRAPNVTAPVRSGVLDGDPSIAGMLGLNLLRQMDVELDMKNAKLNLYSPDHCPGKVVYWASSYVPIPLKTDPAGHNSFKMTLDGETVMVQINNTEESGRMDVRDAKRLFDIEPSSPGMQPVQPFSDAAPVYRYPFKSLTADGVVITNPIIELIVKSGPWPCDGKLHGDQICYGGNDLTIGRSELRAMHIYFAFKEHMIYLTAADAHL